MIAEPLFAAPMPAPGKEAEIAASEALSLAEKPAVVAALVRSIQDLFALLPQEKQAELLALWKNERKEFAASALPPLSSTYGILKDHPAADEYEQIMRELKEQNRRESELLYPDEDETDTGERHGYLAESR